ncbi:RidA family protein [Carboxylicivirga linearis]|uniref:Chorismatase FkbO/Hyg5-like N-terminal domain-containing protein n=1 Tax=Carboxylicivirga linearis TaxID=1628157 RepID=A0ABS5JTU3_9BACT|nr:RidA family protein [Carboxylicivirga linearis]MBS2098302.1 hypothetical protein [Carboxylicivirga linearis]
MTGNVIKRVYKVIQPLERGDLHREWQSCINQISQLKLNHIFKITVFVDEKNWKNALNELPSKLKAVFPNTCPAFTFLSQTPGSNKITMEVGLVNNDKVSISHKMYHNTSFSLIEYEGNTELWASGLGLTSDINDITSSATQAFEELISLLASEGFSLNDVVRQWNYIPKILGFEMKDGKEWQHYQLFNEVRRHYYNTHRTVEGYPAATGIGVAKGSVSIDICAIKTKDADNIYSINNPEQVNAYQYKQDVLIGELVDGTRTKQAPQFERAKLISQPKSGTLFISGTASIKGQYTIGIDNIDEQTNTTLGLMQKLSATAQHTNEYSTNNSICYSYARVYIKNTEDFKAVQSICKDELQNIPINFVQADVCRDNLLVEIEAEMNMKPQKDMPYNSPVDACHHSLQQ